MKQLIPFLLLFSLGTHLHSSSTITQQPSLTKAEIKRMQQITNQNIKAGWQWTSCVASPIGIPTAAAIGCICGIVTGPFGIMAKYKTECIDPEKQNRYTQALCIACLFSPCICTTALIFGPPIGGYTGACDTAQDYVNFCLYGDTDCQSKGTCLPCCD